MNLVGTAAVVTGATSGIGMGIARVFARAGAYLVLVGRDVDSGEALADELSAERRAATFVRCDVSDEKQVVALRDQAVERMGRVTCLVNCAGTGVYEPIADAEVEDIDRILSVNLRGYMLTMKYLLPIIRKSGGGSVVNISSVHSIASSPADAPYAATKGAIDALTRSTAIDEAPEIRVNAIQPGWVESSLTAKIFEDLAPTGRSGDEVRELIARAQPLGRIGTPEDIGEAAAFLASRASSFITGASLAVDGGLTSFLENWDQAKVERLLAQEAA